MGRELAVSYFLQNLALAWGDSGGVCLAGHRTLSRLRRMTDS
jgi:hypothetical protein